LGEEVEEMGELEEKKMHGTSSQCVNCPNYKGIKCKCDLPNFYRKWDENGNTIVN
jgi:hypothetical protein